MVARIDGNSIVTPNFRENWNRQVVTPIRIWRVGIFWYIFALLFQIVFFYGGKIIDTLFGNLYEVTSPLISVYGSQAALMAPMVVLFAFPGAFAEELGWRGYLLPRLQNKFNALISSIVVAIFWGAWHIPLLIYFGDLGVNDYAGYTMVVMNFIPIAIIYTWITTIHMKFWFGLSLWSSLLLKV